MLNSRSISHGRYQPQASGKGGGGAGGGTGGNGAVESALRAVPVLGTGVLGAAALVRQGSGAIVRGAGAVGRRASEASGLTQRRVARDDKSLQTGYYEPSDDDIGSSEDDEEPHEGLQQGSAQSMVSEECAIPSTNKRGQRRQLVRSGSGSSSISSRGADSEGALPTTSQRGKGRVASGLFSSMRSAGRSVRASLGMPSSRRGTSESSAAASDDARGGKDARGRGASGEELAVAKDEVLQQYMVQARSLLRTLDDACGEAAAWEASALTAVAATETCHKMMEARLIVSRGKDELAKLGIVRSAFEKYTSVATSASLDSLRSLSALAGAARAGIMRVLSLAGCQRADARDKQIQSYRKAAANCISEASQALDDLNTQLSDSQRAFAVGAGLYYAAVARALSGAASSPVEQPPRDAEEGWADFQDSPPQTESKVAAEDDGHAGAGRVSFGFIERAASTLSGAIAVMLIPIEADHLGTGSERSGGGAVLVQLVVPS
eukprot:PRCOL_00001196-RA